MSAWLLSIAFQLTCNPELLGFSHTVTKKDLMWFAEARFSCYDQRPLTGSKCTGRTIKSQPSAACSYEAASRQNLFPVKALSRSVREHMYYYWASCLSLSQMAVIASSTELGLGGLLRHQSCCWLQYIHCPIYRDASNCLWLGWTSLRPNYRNSHLCSVVMKPWLVGTGTLHIQWPHKIKGIWFCFI